MESSGAEWSRVEPSGAGPRVTMATLTGRDIPVSRGCPGVLIQRFTTRLVATYNVLLFIE